MTSRAPLRALSVLLALALGGCAGTHDARSHWQNRLELAEAQIARGRHAGARLALEPLRAQEGPADLRQRFYVLLGDTWFADGRWDEALDAWHAARRHPADDDDAGPLILRTAAKLAVANEKLERWHAAARHWHEIVDSTTAGPQRDVALLGLARAEHALRHVDEARAWLAQIQDHDTFGYAELARALAEAPATPPRRAPPVAPPPAPRPVEKPTSAPGAPRIHPRSAWQAQTLRPSGRPEAMETPWRITVHHGGDGQPAPTGLEQARGVMRKYQAWHFERDWADIGYHFVIDGAGRVWEGRELRWQGAHAGTAELNRGNVGICLMGTFSRVDPSDAQQLALKELVAWLMRRYGIAASRVLGHGETLSAVPGRGTECPGARLSSHLRRLRDELSRG